MVKILQILFYPNPILLQKAEKIIHFDKNLKELSQNMLKTVEHYKGIGLAASRSSLIVSFLKSETRNPVGTQVGVLKRIFVMRLERLRRPKRCSSTFASIQK